MIAALWLRFKGWAIAIGVALATVYVAWRRGRSSGLEDARIQREADRAQRNAEAAIEIHEAAKERNHVESDIALGGDPVERLRDDWTARN
jgi:hypothetical protein